jgi:hypothetical protein
MRCLCGDDDGELAKITAWREPAEEMGAAGVRRGDVIHFDGISTPFNLNRSVSDRIDRAACDVGRGRRDGLHRCAHPPHARDGVLPHAACARRAFGPCASARPEARRERAGGAAGAECRRVVRASCGAAVRYACEVYTNDLYMRNGFDAYLSGFE